jgi:hypothetical protein
LAFVPKIPRAREQDIGAVLSGTLLPRERRASRRMSRKLLARESGTLGSLSVVRDFRAKPCFLSSLRIYRAAGGGQRCAGSGRGRRRCSARRRGCGARRRHRCRGRADRVGALQGSRDCRDDRLAADPRSGAGGRAYPGGDAEGEGGVMTPLIKGWFPISGAVDLNTYLQNPEAFEQLSSSILELSNQQVLSPYGAAVAGAVRLYSRIADIFERFV